MLGAIALHAVHRAGAVRGEAVAVLGLGLLGQLTVQLLKAAGCRVVAHDPDPSRTALAQRLGADAVALTADDVRAGAAAASGGLGVDAVIVTAATESNVPLLLAAEIARVRAAVVMVGVTGMHVPRREFWEKELSLLLSKAAGPESEDDHAGRRTSGDASGPAWTARRNMAAFTAEVARGAVRVEPLITHRFPIERAGDAYALIRGNAPHLGVVLTYPAEPASDRAHALRQTASERSPGIPRRTTEPRTIGIGVVGAGLFAQTVLLPALRGLPGLRFRGIATASGLSARHAGDRLGFEFCTTEAGAVLSDRDVDAVIIATRHDLHARLAAEALRAGKHVFVEKPLGLIPDEIRAVLEAHAASSRVLMVGFNRRFSPLARAVKGFIEGVHPLTLTYRVNAGELAADHWVYDPVEGGGRWLGEGGHFVDLLQYLTGSDPVRVFAQRLDAGRAPGESFMIALAFEDGSAATIVYADGADRAESRERVEVLGPGFACTLEDFRRVSLARGGRVRRIRRWEGARGHPEELAAWAAAVRGEAPAPADAAAYAANAACCFAVPESARTGAPVAVDPSGMLPAAAPRPEG
jgi:predicted dehydrogenase